MADLRAAGNNHSRRPMAFSPRRTVIVATVAALVCAGGAWAQPSGAAPTTLEKIEASGKVVLGGRESATPMAYALGANEKYLGYHVELYERLLRQIPPAAKLEFMAVTAQNTLP